MRTEDLEYLHAVAKTKSLNKASQQLNIPYQSINNGIKNLEAEFHTTLLERHPNGSFLTESGKVLEKFAGKLFKDMESLRSSIDRIEAQNTKNNISGTLTIIVASPVNLSFFPLLVKEFNQAYPKVALTAMTENDINKIVSAFSASQIDIAFTFATNDDLTMLSSLGYISYKKFAKHDAYIACSAKHPLAKKVISARKPPSNILSYFTALCPIYHNLNGC